MAQLLQALSPKRDIQDTTVKNQLKNNTEQAIAQAVFGVPTFAINDKLFWGLDALPMMRQYIEKNPLFDEADWQSVESIKTGITRKP